MHHPWLNKGFNGLPENYLPAREPLALPLDPLVVEGMTGFEFGTSEVIMEKLTKIIEGEDYQAAVRNAARDTSVQSPGADKKKSFGFDFYKRRSSTSSKDTLTNPSTEVLSHLYVPDPINAYHPLVSIYYLVKEKLEHDSRLATSGAQLALPPPDPEKVAKSPILKQPEVAHTSETSYGFHGDASTTTGARTRPRARTHGDEEVSEIKKVSLKVPGSVSPTPLAAPTPAAASAEEPVKKESAAASLFRRFSTRKGPKPPPPPTLSLQAPGQTSPVDISGPRKSLSLRRREPPQPTIHSAGSQPQHKDLLTPPTTADDSSARKSSKLGRSTSVTEPDWRRRYSRGESSGDGPPGTSGSDHSTASKPEGSRTDKLPVNPQQMSLRTKSLGHARRESYQARRTRREESNLPDNVPEEGVNDAGTSAGSADAKASATPSSDFVKPVYLKGLFSVATTSTKPPTVIRADIIRVLEQLGVSYKEIKGGFSCVHRPSIDLKSVVDTPATPEATNMVMTPSHRRRLSFGGNTNTNHNTAGPSQSSPSKSPRRGRVDTIYTSSDVSSESVQESSLGGSLILQFEIYIVKVPLLSLHGIQFKSVNKTNTWQYKSLASKILSELRL